MRKMYLVFTIIFSALFLSACDSFGNPPGVLGISDAYYDNSTGEIVLSYEMEILDVQDGELVTTSDLVFLEARLNGTDEWFEIDNLANLAGKNISVDYAIMETSKNVFVISAEFDWNDLGTWGSLYDKITDQPTENAIVNARLLAENASGNLIKTDTNKIVVLDSLDDFIVVEEKEILLIFPKSKDQDIKELRKRVKDKFGDQHI